MRLRYGPSQNFEWQYAQCLNDCGEAKWCEPISHSYAVRPRRKRANRPYMIYCRKWAKYRIKAPRPINKDVYSEATYGNGGVVGSTRNSVTYSRCQMKIDDLPRLRSIGVKCGRADESLRRPRKRRNGDEEGKQ